MIPALGILGLPSSGKTVYLAMLADYIGRIDQRYAVRFANENPDLKKGKGYILDIIIRVAHTDEPGFPAATDLTSIITLKWS